MTTAAGSKRQNGPKDFRSRFHLNTTPFSRELSIERRYLFSFIEEAIEGLYQAVLQRESCALIAPAGSGKTVAVRALNDRLPETRFKVRYVKMTGLSEAEGLKSWTLLLTFMGLTAVIVSLILAIVLPLA